MTTIDEQPTHPAPVPGPFATPPCRVLLVPAANGVRPVALEDVTIDLVVETDEGVDRADFRALVGDNQDRTVLITAPTDTLQALLGRITGADPARFVLAAGSFSLAEVGPDGRGVLHLLNWGALADDAEPAADVCRVILLRHGQSMVVEGGGQVWSHHPIGLTPLGHKQAGAASMALAGVQLAAIYSSDLTRAVETAGHVAKPHDLEPIVDAALKEVALGDFEGLTLADVYASGDHRYLPWLEVTFNEEFPHEAFHHPADLLFPAGESVLLVHDRVRAAFSRIVAQHLGSSIALVSHTWTIQPLLAYVTGGDPRDYYRFPLRYATSTAVEVPADGPGRLLRLNADLALDEVAGKRLVRKGS